MPEYLLKVVDQHGVMTSLGVSADSRESALREVLIKGYTPIEVSVESGGGVRPAGVRRTFWSVSRPKESKESPDGVLFLLKELGSLLRAGLPIDRSLRVLAEMKGELAAESVEQALLERIKTGKSLSQAMKEFPGIFEPLHFNLVKSGEMSGNVGAALQYLTDYLDKAKELRSNVVSALMYPGILLTTAVLSVGLMLGFVVPQFKPLFHDLGDRLPLITSVVVSIGDMVVGYWMYLLSGLCALSLAVSRWWVTPGGLRSKERLLLALPLVGELFRAYQVARFTRTAGTLLANGIGPLPSIAIARDSVTFSVIRDRLDPLADAVKQGHRFSSALRACDLFDSAALQLIGLGEETGRLDEMMLELAQRMEISIQVRTKRALTLLEPLLILSLGMLVAIIIIAILLGILSVNELVA